MKAMVQPLPIVVDSREQCPHRFAGRPVTTERLALPAGEKRGDALHHYPVPKISSWGFPARRSGVR